MQVLPNLIKYQPSLEVGSVIIFNVEKRTMSLGFGASVMVEPLTFFDLSIFATICAYGTAAMDAKP